MVAHADGSVTLSKAQADKVKLMIEELTYLRRKSDTLEALMTPREKRLKAFDPFKTVIMCAALGVALVLGIKVNDYAQRAEDADARVATQQAINGQLISEVLAVVNGAAGALKVSAATVPAGDDRKTVANALAASEALGEKLRLEKMNYESQAALTEATRKVIG
jgi:hypothetical protein